MLGNKNKYKQIDSLSNVRTKLRNKLIEAGLDVDSMRKDLEKEKKEHQSQALPLLRSFKSNKVLAGQFQQRLMLNENQLYSFRLQRNKQEDTIRDNGSNSDISLNGSPRSFREYIRTKIIYDNKQQVLNKKQSKIKKPKSHFFQTLQLQQTLLIEKFKDKVATDLSKIELTEIIQKMADKPKQKSINGLLNKTKTIGVILRAKTQDKDYTPSKSKKVKLKKSKASFFQDLAPWKFSQHDQKWQEMN